MLADQKFFLSTERCVLVTSIFRILRKGVDGVYLFKRYAHLQHRVRQLPVNTTGCESFSTYCIGRVRVGVTQFFRLMEGALRKTEFFNNRALWVAACITNLLSAHVHIFLSREATAAFLYCVHVCVSVCSFRTRKGMFILAVNCGVPAVRLPM